MFMMIMDVVRKGINQFFPVPQEVLGLFVLH